MLLRKFDIELLGGPPGAPMGAAGLQARVSRLRGPGVCGPPVGGLPRNSLDFIGIAQFPRIPKNYDFTMIATGFRASTGLPRTS